MIHKFPRLITIFIILFVVSGFSAGSVFADKIETDNIESPYEITSEEGSILNELEEPSIEGVQEVVDKETELSESIENTISETVETESASEPEPAEEETETNDSREQNILQIDDANLYLSFCDVNTTFGDIFDASAVIAAFEIGTVQPVSSPYIVTMHNIPENWTNGGYLYHLISEEQADQNLRHGISVFYHGTENDSIYFENVPYTISEDSLTFSVNSFSVFVLTNESFGQFQPYVVQEGELEGNMKEEITQNSEEESKEEESTAEKEEESERQKEEKEETEKIEEPTEAETLPSEMSVTVTITWTNDDGRYDRRPTSVSVTLYQNDFEYASYELTEEENWIKIISNLPIYDENGVEYHYSILEDSVSRYDTSINDFNIVNKYRSNVTGEYAITATVSVLGQDITANQYKFELLDNNKHHLDYAFNDDLGMVSFTPLLYSSSEFIEDADDMLYEYYIREIAGEDSDTVYDTRYNKVSVFVENTGDPVLSVSQLFHPNIVNKYIKRLEIQNQTDGDSKERSNRFHYTLTLTGDNVDKNPVTYKRGTESGLVPLQDGSYSFALADDEYITFSGIIADVNYNVEIADAETLGYTTSIKGTPSAVLNKDTGVIFTNTKLMSTSGKVRQMSLLFIIPTVLAAIVLFLMFRWIWRKHFTETKNKNA